MLGEQQELEPHAICAVIFSSAASSRRSMIRVPASLPRRYSSVYGGGHRVINDLGIIV
jgi:hypothetical protein